MPFGKYTQTLPHWKLLRENQWQDLAPPKQGKLLQVFFRNHLPWAEELAAWQRLFPWHRERCLGCRKWSKAADHSCGDVFTCKTSSAATGILFVQLTKYLNEGLKHFQQWLQKRQVLISKMTLGQWGLGPSQVLAGRQFKVRTFPASAKTCTDSKE